MSLEFRILGPIEVVGAVEPIRLGGPKQRGVLAILLLHANRVVPVEQIANELYDDKVPATAVAQVRDHVSQLRKLLAEGEAGVDGSVLETRAPGYLLRIEPGQLDAACFESRTEEAAGALRRGEAGLAADLLREALALWRGPPLADFAYEAFAQAEIARLDELRLVATERRVEADLALGADGALVGELQALVRDHPLRERLRVQLMLALYRSGRQAEALDVYHVTRAMLVDELGLEPSEALGDLAGRILRHDPSLAQAPAHTPPAFVRQVAPAPVRNPYKGLRAFDEDDAPDFFGREALALQLVERLGDSRFVAVVGPSGSGKSSVVRAGLIPALREGALPGSEAWGVADLTPGAYPLEELEAVLLRMAVNPPSSLIEQLGADDRGLLRAVKRVLPSDRSELVLVIDQLEELFTLVEDDAVRIHVLGMIERAVRDPGSRLRVVVTLRADFYDRPLLYRGFAELLRDGVVTVAPLSPEEIERAIAAPAHGAGVVLEHGLLAETVADVLDEPGALPLLQYALTELFERREEATLTCAAYATIGGVSGALARRAEELYAGLRTPDTTRQLFLQLVTPGETADTRRRVERAELESLDVDQHALTECIDVFGASRLLSFDRDPRSGRSTVEIAHEALLTQWGRLREWIDAARDDVRMHQRLAAAAVGWNESGRDPSFLLRGSRLTGFESWAAASELAQTELDRAYLDTSLQERRAERAAEESRRAREAALERRSVNRLRAIIAVLATAGAVAAGLTVFAFDQSSRSERAADLAEARELAAASVANLDVDPELSILLARQAVRKAEVEGPALSQAADALHQAVATSRILLTVRDPATTAAAFSPDGSRIATAGTTRTQAYLWDAHTGKRLLTFKASAPIHNIAFSPDGSHLATSSENGDAILWNSRTGRRLVVLPHPGTSGAAPAVAFSRDGRLGTVDQTGRVRIWDVRRKRLVRMIQAPYGLCGIAWSHDGTRIGAGHCAGSLTRTGRVWDARTGRLLFRTSRQLEAVFAIDLSPDGQHVATGGYDGVVRIWNLRTKRLDAELRGHAGAVLALAYSRDGTLLATSGTDATARVWDAHTGVQLLVLHGHSAGIGSLAFAPDGRSLVTASEDGTAKIWDVTPEGGRDWLTLVTNAGGVESVLYSRDGARLLTTSIGTQPSNDRVSTAHVWNARTGALVRSYPLTTEGGWGAPASYSPEGRIHIFVPTTTSPNGTIAAVAVTDGSGATTGAVELYETTSGERKLLATLPGRHRGLQDIEFNRSGKLAATAYADGTAIVWDVASGRALDTFAAHNGVVESVAFSPDGTLLATAGNDTTAKLWDLKTGKRLLTLRGHTGALTDLAFSPDGSRLATGSLDGTIRVYVLPVEELMTASLARLTRDWSVAECARYLPGVHCPSQP